MSQTEKYILVIVLILVGLLIIGGVIFYVLFATGTIGTGQKYIIGYDANNFAFVDTNGRLKITSDKSKATRFVKQDEHNTKVGEGSFSPVDTVTVFRLFIPGIQQDTKYLGVEYVSGSRYRTRLTTQDGRENYWIGRDQIDNTLRSAAGIDQPGRVPGLGADVEDSEVFFVIEGKGQDFPDDIHLVKV